MSEETTEKCEDSFERVDDILGVVCLDWVEVIDSDVVVPVLEVEKLDDFVPSFEVDAEVEDSLEMSVDVVNMDDEELSEVSVEASEVVVLSVGVTLELVGSLWIDVETVDDELLDVRSELADDKIVETKVEETEEEAKIGDEIDGILWDEFVSESIEGDVDKSEENMVEPEVLTVTSEVVDKELCKVTEVPAEVGWDRVISDEKERTSLETSTEEDREEEDLEEICCDKEDASYEVDEIEIMLELSKAVEVVPNGVEPSRDEDSLVSVYLFEGCSWFEVGSVCKVELKVVDVKGDLDAPLPNGRNDE